MHKVLQSCCLLTVILLMTIPALCAEPRQKQSTNVSGAPEKTKAPQARKVRKPVALVIGNSQYASSPLKAPINEAHILAATLRRLGFNVLEKNNLGHVALKKAVADFGKQMKGGKVGLFYYSGHGLQQRGLNYLVPVDAQIRAEDEILQKSVPVDLVLDTMQKAENEVNIVILNAACNKPFGNFFQVTSPGFAGIVAPSNTIISYATAPGMSITDCNNTTIGAYTEALVLALDTPGLELEQLFSQLSQQVEDKTAGAQVPWRSSSLKRGKYLVPPLGISGSRPPPTDLPLEDNKPPRTGFTEPITGMEFLPVQGGCFQMGDTFDEGFAWEKPAHIACVNDFAIGKYEVTQGQWKRVMGNNPAEFSNCGDDCPVEQVSWDDAQKFVRKLNKLSGGKYRLPTEAEWEYAARSGGKNERYNRDDVNAVAWHNQNSASMPHRVGGKQANGLGIHDIKGNVWEWVQDWYGSYSRSRQENPTGPSTGTFRVFRGGSWSHGPEHARPAIRYYSLPEKRINFLGLRLAAPIVRMK